jgi:murein L,D-transpeptidase YcbB/YkuD
MRKPRFMLITLSAITLSLAGTGAILSSGTHAPAQGPVVISLAASLSKTDEPIARALRYLMSGTYGQLGDSRATRRAIKDFYAARGFAPLWTEDGAPGRRLRAAQDYIEAIGAEGLDPKDYPLPEFKPGDPGALAAAELQATSAVVRLARHAQNGRVAHARVGPDIHYDAKPTRMAEILATIEQAENVADVLSALHPTHDGYRALRAKLAGLPAEDPARDIVVANMERWHWLPRDLGSNRVVVNIPDYTLILLRDGAPHFKAKIVVGKRSLPTPLLSSTMTSLTVNPIWNVPRSIAENEMLPAFAKNPDLPAQLGLTVAARTDGSSHVYQLPGAKNALGRVRFNFPNKFSVYQHDTPDTFLFEQQARAFSHGCVRVEHAVHYAVALLSIARPSDGTTHENLRALFGEREIEIDLRSPVSVHLTYQTAFVDEDGQLVLTPDIYGYDVQTTAALRNPEAAVAQHKPLSVSRPAGRSWYHRVTGQFRRLADRTRASLDQVIASAGGIVRLRP